MQGGQSCRLLRGLAKQEKGVDLIVYLNEEDILLGRQLY